MININSYSLHSVQCELKVSCGICNERVFINYLQTHLQNNHKCPHCHIQLDTILENHECERMLIECRYCLDYFMQMELSHHERECINRTTQCDTCKKMIPNISWRTHLNSRSCQPPQLPFKTNEELRKEVLYFIRK
jgi:hypothetical protein